MRLVGRFMVTGGDPRTADFDFAAGDAIPRNLSCHVFGVRLAFGAHQANFNEWRRPTLFGADFILFFLGPLVHVRTPPPGCADRIGLGHAPQVLDVQVKAIEIANQFERWSSASANNANGMIEFPAAGIFFEGLEHADPHGGDTASDGYALAHHQAKHTFWVNVWAGKNETRAKHGASVGQSPGVGMEHGSDRQNGVELAHAEDFVEAARKGVQHQRAVGIDDTFRATGRAGSKAHGGAIVFIDQGIAEIVAGFGEEFFVIHVLFRDAVAAVRHNDDVFVGNSFTVFFKERQKNIVDQKEAVVGLPDDGGNFVGMEAEIQSMKDAASARNAKKSFQVSRAVPHHAGNAVTRPQAEFSQRRSEAARAPVEVAVARARDGLVRFAGADLDARKSA